LGFCAEGEDIAIRARGSALGERAVDRRERERERERERQRERERNRRRESVRRNLLSLSPIVVEPRNRRRE